MRTPEQVVADLRKAEKTVEEATANVNRFRQELAAMAVFVNQEMNAAA